MIFRRKEDLADDRGQESADGKVVPLERVANGTAGDLFPIEISGR